MADRCGIFVENSAKRMLVKGSPLFGHPNGIYDSVIVEVSPQTYITNQFHEWMCDEVIPRLSSQGIINIMIKQ